MISRKPSSRWALWVFAAALLLKAAMPMLASVSAQAQGKAVVEICTAYGVSLVALDGKTDANHGQPATPVSEHGGDHCALNALTALATAQTPTLMVALPSVRDRAAPPVRSSPRPADASAAWIARLRHGPPPLA